MRAHDLISENEARRILRAYDFLWRIRHSTHFQFGRKTERLSLDLQPNLAEQFRYEPGTFLLGSEKLMRDYYRHARELNLFSEGMVARIVDDQPRPSRRWTRRPTYGATEPFAIRRGRLHFDGEADFFEKKPMAIFNAVRARTSRSRSFRLSSARTYRSEFARHRSGLAILRRRFASLLCPAAPPWARRLHVALNARPGIAGAFDP